MIAPARRRRALLLALARGLGLGAATAAASLALALVRVHDSWLDNGSAGEVWLKPEEGTEPVRVAPGLRLDVELDGLAAPAIRRGAVFKTCDGCAATLRGSSIETRCASLAGAACQRLRGGWKDEAWVRLHEDFRPLFERSR